MSLSVYLPIHTYRYKNRDSRDNWTFIIHEEHVKIGNVPTTCIMIITWVLDVCIDFTYSHSSNDLVALCDCMYAYLYIYIFKKTLFSFVQRSHLRIQQIISLNTSIVFKHTSI